MTDDHTHQGDDVHSVEAAMKDANGGWQPIETAPKDVASLLFSFESGPSVKHWGGFCGHNQPCFTHWMPLPAAPTEGE
jgi:hypothetical protein